MSKTETRAKAAMAFIAASGWSDANRFTVAGDASNRRYDRLIRHTGETVILMDAPADKGEDVRPFVAIAQHLNDTGLNAPSIIANDSANGFLLLEDLGDDLFARVMSDNKDLETPLYEVAVDVLVHLHRAKAPELEPYDALLMTKMAALAYDWYLFGATDTKQDAKQKAFEADFNALLTPLDVEPSVLIQRDYHAENLLWLPERDGVKRVGLLDFQDAMLGHPAYDLVSILQDARRDVSAQIEPHMLARYITATRQNTDSFHAAYALLGLQRNMRILGVFARLCMAHGKAHYVDLIPRVWGHIETNLAHPALTSVADRILADLPRPTPDILEKLKSKCATHPVP